MTPFGTFVRRIVTLACFTLVAESAWASVITGVDRIVGPGLGAAAAVVTTGAENNDNVVAGNPNTIVITKRFDRVAPIDIVFRVSNSVGPTLIVTTEYFIRDTVTNNTGVTWIDYHFELGFGTGAAFVRSNLFDMIDFDVPDRDPVPTSTKFTRLLHQANTIDWRDGAVSQGEMDLFTLSIDVFNGSNQIPMFARFPTCNGYFLTLRQVPTVPEPATFALLALGVCGALARRRHRSS